MTQFAKLPSNYEPKLYNAFKVSDLADASICRLPSSCSVETIRISDLSSFRGWRGIIQNHLTEKCAQGSLSTLATQTALSNLLADQFISIINGPANVICYKWANGEPKILLAWDDQIIVQSDTFWLPSYPFLEYNQPSQNGECSVFTLRKGIGAIHYRNICDNRIFVNVSHNDHIGHFILDNLPLLQLINGPMLPQVDRQALTGLYLYNKGITSLLEYCRMPISSADNKNIFKNLSPGALATVKYCNCLEIFATSTFVNAFIWRKSMVHHLKGGLAKSSSLKVALLRQGRYSSRIYNKNEVDMWLKKNNFAIIDPSEFEPHQLINILTSARIVVSESGTCTLNACMFSSDESRIISLVPARLILEPDLPMIHGGHPYILPFIDKLTFVPGETRIRSAIQSSDVCYYDTSYLEKAINEI